MTTSSSTKRRISLYGAAALSVAVGLFASCAPPAALESPRDSPPSSVADKQLSLPDEPEVLWNYQSEETAFEATPVVADGVVYLGDADGTMHAIRLDSGEAVWSRLFEDSGFTSACVVQGDRLFVGDFNGVVRCLSTTDGAELWSFAAETEVHGLRPYEQYLLATTEGGALIAIDAAKGEERWRFSIDAPLQCAPTVAAGHTLLAGCDEKLHAVDLATGQEVGSVGIGGPTGATAAVADGVAYFGTEGGLFFAVDAATPAKLAVKWQYQDRRRAQGIRTTAAIGENLLVYGSNGKAIYGLDRQSGEEVWVRPTRSRVEASPAITGQRVAAATTRGRVLLLNLTDGEVVWEYDAGGGFVSSPVIAGDKLLAANDDGTLYCFGENASQE